MEKAACVNVEQDRSVKQGSHARIGGNQNALAHQAERNAVLHGEVGTAFVLQEVLLEQTPFVGPYVLETKAYIPHRTPGIPDHQNVVRPNENREGNEGPSIVG